VTVVLPYDGSGVARAALARLLARSDDLRSTREIVLLLPWRSACGVRRQRHEARRIAGPGVRLSVRLLTKPSLAGALHALVCCHPGALFVAPVDSHGATAWYRHIAGELIAGGHLRCLALFLGPIDRRRSPPAASRTRRRSRARPHRRAIVNACCRAGTRAGATEVER
jgi:hypothetical protein